jgi:hypothetical protein
LACARAHDSHRSQSHDPGRNGIDEEVGGLTREVWRGVLPQPPKSIRFRRR